jgi:hypothetical protein
MSITSTSQVKPVTFSFGRALRAAYQGNPLLAGLSVFLLLWMAPTIVAFQLDARQLNGVSVWIKPMKFQVSLSFHMLTMAWLALLLPDALRRGWQVWAIAFAVAAASLFEAVYITWAAANGVKSHFNLETEFASMMYSLMGVGSVILVGGTIWLGVLILRKSNGPRVLAKGAGWGLVLGGLLGGITGAWMSAQLTGHWVGGVLNDSGGLPLFGWARDGGDLRVAHFFGLHMMQVLPLMAVLLWQRGVAGWRRALTLGAVAGSTLSLGTFVQAYLGRPFF